MGAGLASELHRPAHLSVAGKGVVGLRAQVRTHMQKRGYVYILASERNGTLYIGVTSDLVKRIWQHREGQSDGFSHQYNVRHLVYFEIFDDMMNAIAREKAMKKWLRKWKIEAIEKNNPSWRDLFDEIAR